MPIGEVTDSRMETAEDLCDTIHSAANIVRTAITTKDPSTAKALRTAAKALLKTVMARLDESVGESAAIEEEDD